MLLVLATLLRLSWTARAHNGRQVRIFRAAEGNLYEALTTPVFAFAREAAHMEGIDLGLTLLGEASDNAGRVREFVRGSLEEVLSVTATREDAM